MKCHGKRDLNRVRIAQSLMSDGMVLFRYCDMVQAFFSRRTMFNVNSALFFVTGVLAAFEIGGEDSWTEDHRVLAFHDQAEYPRIHPLPVTLACHLIHAHAHANEEAARIRSLSTLVVSFIF